MTQTFKMPVFAGEMLDGNTDTVLRASWHGLRDANPTLRFIEFRIFITNDGDGFCVPSKDINLIDDARLTPQTAVQIPAEIMAQIHLAWGEDGLVEQCILAHPLPFAEMDKHRFMSLFWSPNCCVLAQEYLPSFLDEDAGRARMTSDDLKERSSVASMIVPLPQSHHEAIAYVGKLPTIQADIDWLWTRITLGMDPIAMKLDDPLNPMELP